VVELAEFGSVAEAEFGWAEQQSRSLMAASPAELREEARPPDFLFAARWGRFGLQGLNRVEESLAQRRV
jgi:hypothetical protein